MSAVQGRDGRYPHSLDDANGGRRRGASLIHHRAQQHLVAPVRARHAGALTDFGDALVRSAVDGGAATLAEVTTQVLPLYPCAERFAVAGRVAVVVAAGSRVNHPRSRALVNVGDGLEIDHWALRDRRPE